MSRKFALLACLIALLGMAACAAPAPTTSPTEASGPEQTPTTDPDDVLLRWEGQTDQGCSIVEVTITYQLMVGQCGKLPKISGEEITQEDSHLFLTQMAADLAPFDATVNSDHVIFKGNGSSDSAAWQRAVGLWARWTFAEEFSGKVCAACRTVLSWPVGPTPENAAKCGQLVVMNFGVAYAQKGPCDSGEMTLVKRGVVTTRHWESFDGWLSEFQAYSADADNFNGQGSAELSNSNIAQIDTWAHDVYDEVLAAPEP